MRPDLLSSAVLVAFAAGVAVRGGAPQDQPPPPTFRTGVNLVRVDVTVTDGRGGPVLDLAADDFTVLEDDVPQTIVSFKLAQLHGEQTPGDDLSLEIRSPEHGEAEAAREDVRLFAIFLDDYHVQRGRDTLIVRDALTRFVRDELRPTDLVVLMDPLTPLSALRFTRDKYALTERIRAFEGRRGIYTPTRSVIEEQQLATRSVERIRTEVTMSALKALVTHLGSIRESRKAVVFVSEGFGVPVDLAHEFREVYEAASQNNAAIYAVDPRGLMIATDFGSLTVLRSLADHSGGRAIVNVNGVEDRLDQVVRDSSAYYVIGYASTQTPADGKFHKIAVRVRRRGIDVHARKGYWAPTAAEVARARQPPSELPPAIARAWAALAVPRDGRAVDTWVGMSRGSAGRTRVAFVWQPHARRSSAAAPARVRLTASGSAGTTYLDDAISVGEPSVAAAAPAEISFDVPPGSMRLRITVEDARDQVLDSEVRDVVVPDMWSVPLLLTTPRVLRARTTPELKDLLSNSSAPAWAGRDFARTDRVLVRFAAYSTSPRPPTISARLLNRQGAPLTDLSVSPCTAADATHQIDVPLSSLAPGDYVIQVEVRADGAVATEMVPVRAQS